MSPKWIIFLLQLWGYGALLGFILEGAFFGADEQTILNTLINCKALTATSWLGTITGVITDLEMWWALGKVFIWDFSFWNATAFGIPLELVRWLILLPISAGILGSLALAWIRGVGSS